MSNLSIIKQPPAIALVDDGLIWKIYTNNRVQSWGTNSQLSINFPDISSPGYDNKTFSIEFVTKTIVFTFKTNPDSSGNQLNTRSAGQSYDDFIQQIKTDLQKNFYISRHYKVSTSSVQGRIILFAREYGSEYDCTLGDTDISGLIQESTTNGAETTYRNNYRILMEVYEKGTEFDQSLLLGTDGVEPDSEGYALFDMHELCKVLIKSVFEWPETSSKLFHERSEAVARVFFRYCEIYNGEGKLFESTFYNHTVILPGGSSWRDKNYYLKNGIGYFNDDSNLQRFLTWQPLVKKTGKTSSEKLFFFFTDESKIVDLKVKILYFDGSDETFIAIESLEPAQYSIYELHTSYEMLGIEAKESAAGKTAKKYELWLEDSLENTLSETRTFEIDQQEYLNERQFVFKNSFGMYDTLRCTGITEKYNEYERTLLECEHDIDQMNKEKKFFAEYHETFTSNVGFITKEWKKYLEEFILSDEVFEVTEGNQILPVLITTKKVFQYKDDITLYDLEFEYRRAFTNDHYSDYIDESINYLRDENNEILQDENNIDLLDSNFVL